MELRGAVLFLFASALFFHFSFDVIQVPQESRISEQVRQCRFDLDGEILRLVQPSENSNTYYTTTGADPISGGKPFEGQLDLSSLQGNLDQAYQPTGIKWKRPVQVKQAMHVLRARSYVEGIGWGRDTILSIPIGHGPSKPFVSLVTDPKNLFDPDTGIYLVGNAFFRGSPSQVVEHAKNNAWWLYPGNYRERGKAWERQAHFEYHRENGAPLLASVGIRVNGNMTRAFADRSIRVLFPQPMYLEMGKELAPCDAIVLRNGGNDRHRTKMRDLLLARIAEPLDLEVQAGITVPLFVNGVYWGVFNMRERLNEEHLRHHYLDAGEKCTILEDGGELSYGRREAQEAFFSALRQVEQLEFRTLEDLEQAGKWFDLDNFMDYMACEMYFANTDWPHQNVKIWRKEDPATAWRWMLNDMDLSFGYPGASSSGMDMFAHVAKATGPTARLFRTLMRSSYFRTFFKERLEQLMAEQFSFDRVQRLILDQQAVMAPHMEAHIARWGYPKSVDKWRDEVEVLRKFSAERHKVMLDHIEIYLAS